MVVDKGLKEQLERMQKVKASMAPMVVYVLLSSIQSHNGYTFPSHLFSKLDREGKIFKKEL